MHSEPADAQVPPRTLSFLATASEVQTATVETDTRIAGAETVPLSVLFTLVLWLGCLAVGVLGLTTPYIRPEAQVHPFPSIQAQMLDVELTAEPLSMPDQVPVSVNAVHPPPALPPITIQRPPELTFVAEPAAAVAFALPVRGPTQSVAPAQASHVRPAEPTAETAAPPAAQPLTFGQGEGKQPAPDYPRQAIRERQEGTVRIRFQLGQDGRVFAPEVVSPSPWPLLNEAALRTVHQRWRFRPDSVRLYEVPIHFELKK